jgi:hypothetical protein
MMKSLTNPADHQYEHLEEMVARRGAGAANPLLITAATGLFEEFLSGLPESSRQHYRCNCCRRFVERFGAAVTVGDNGAPTTVFWEPEGVPAFFSEAVERVRRKVVAAPVCGALVSSEKEWGTPETPDCHGGHIKIWTHLHASNPNPFRKTALKNAGQRAAEVAADVDTLKRALSEFPRRVVEQAVAVLETDGLDRSEKATGPARWFLGVHDQLAAAPPAGPRRDNVIWRAAAAAPPGFCHVRSSMVGSLLEDLVAGLEFESVKARWATKMHPLQYQRPTTVSAGNVARAEKVVAELGSAGALSRRFATLDDVRALWRPRSAALPTASAGVFGHLLGTTTRPPLDTGGSQAVTWDKFVRTVLPGAEKIEVLVPNRPAGYFGLVTAADQNAPCLIQWDGEPRNPVSWYFYTSGSYATRWGLIPDKWVAATAVFESPAHWHAPERFKHHGRMGMFALTGARDMEYQQGAGLFPEFLRSEYHEVRSTLEAHVRVTVVAGRDEGDANGLAFQQGGPPLTVRVTGHGVRTTYSIDRLD